MASRMNFFEPSRTYSGFLYETAKRVQQGIAKGERENAENALSTRFSSMSTSLGLSFETWTCRFRVEPLRSNTCVRGSRRE